MRIARRGAKFFFDESQKRRTAWTTCTIIAIGDDLTLSPFQRRASVVIRVAARETGFVILL